MDLFAGIKKLDRRGHEELTSLILIILKIVESLLVDAYHIVN